MAATPPPDFTSAGFNSSVTALVQDKTYNWIGDINASFVLQSGYLVFMSEPLSLLTRGSIEVYCAQLFCIFTASWRSLLSMVQQGYLI